MGGFFSAIGNLGAGAGEGAAAYGHQIRGLLESRRKDFSDLIGNAAQSETDPQTRTALLKHQSDLISGKPIGKITADFQKTVQGRIADQQALHGVIGQPPQAPAPQPGPAQPGSVPGVMPPVQQPPAHTSPLARLISAIRGPGSGAQVGDDVMAHPGAPAPPLAAQPSASPIAGLQGGIKDPSIQPVQPTFENGSQVNHLADLLANTPTDSQYAGAKPGDLLQNGSGPVYQLNAPGGGTGSASAIPETAESSIRFEGQPGFQPVSTPQQPPAPVAAQPSISPIAGPQGGIKAPSAPPQAAPLQNAPIHPIEDPRARRAAILADYGNQYRNATPAMRPIILAQMNDAIQQLQPFEQTAARKAAFEEFSNTPEFKALPAFAQQAYRAQAFGLAPVSMPQGALVPTKYQSRAEDLDPSVRAQFGLGSYKGPITISKSRTDGSIIDVVPGNAGVSIINNPDGTQSFALKTPGESAGVAASQVAPRATGVDAAGHPTFESVADMKKGIAPVTGAGVNPSFVPIDTKHTSVTSPDGTVHSETLRTRTPMAAPGAPASKGATPVPAAKGAPAVPAGGTLPPAAKVLPLDPSNELDHKVLMIAKDAASGGRFLTNAQDKAQVNRRMAELGLEPGMVTSSMRDRAKNARLILTHMDDINRIIDQADKDGDLGVVATRWNDFLTNKIGKDPTKTQVFAKLSSELGFLTTAVSMAHGGLRGGSSPTMVEHWEKALDAKDPTTLKAKLAEAKKWMEGYSRLDNGLVDQPNAPIQPLGRPPLSTFER